jgi:hypothetical protein
MPSAYPVATSIKSGTQSLIRDWKDLNQAYQNFAIKKLRFAEQIAKIWHEAKELDTVQRGEANQNHLREQLRQIIQSDDKSILSKWVGIGTNAQALLPYADSLPAQRDSLYALSTAIGKRKPIQRWIENGKLTSESTVREVFALTTTKKKPQSGAHKQRMVSVTIEISADYASAATLLAPLLFEKDIVRMRSDKAFTSAMKSELGQESFAGVSEKIG